MSDLPLRRIPLTAVRKVVWGGETERGVVLQDMSKKPVSMALKLWPWLSPTQGPHSIGFH